MKHRVYLLKPVTVTNDFGEETPSYEETPSHAVYAELVRATAATRQSLDEHFAAHIRTFRVRDAHKVSEGWRLREVGGLLYTVTAVLPNVDRGFLELTCERVDA